MTSATIYFFKMATCPYCVQLEPILEEVKKECVKKYPSVQFTTIERADIPRFERDHPKLAKLLKISEIVGFPDLRIVVQHNPMITTAKYNGNRTKKDILKWIATNTRTNGIILGGKIRPHTKKHGTRRFRKKVKRTQRYIEK